MVVTVSHLVCRQVARTPHNVRLASQQQSLRVFVHIVEQNLLLLAVRKTSLKQKINEFYPRIRDVFLIDHFSSFEREQFRVLLAIDIDDGVV